MAANAPLVVGIDLAAGRGVTALAALTVEPQGAPRVVAMSHPRSDDDILAETLRLRPALIALDAPLTLPGPVAAALAGAPWSGHASPYTRAAERDPLWRALGVRPLPVSFLGGLTFRAIALAARLRAELPGVTLIEVFPTATLRALGARTNGDGLGAKSSRAARYATLATLDARVVGLAGGVTGDPPDADLLDAVAAALTGAAFLRDATIAVGDSAEGCIITIDAVRFAARFS